MLLGSMEGILYLRRKNTKSQRLTVSREENKGEREVEIFEIFIFLQFVIIFLSLSALVLSDI